MAAVVYPTPGALYLTPTTVLGSTGTLIPGIEERAVGFSDAVDIRRRRTGVGVNSGFRVRHGRVQPGTLVVPLKQQDSTGLKLLLSWLTTSGTDMRPTGGTATSPFGKLPTFALILRPFDTTQKLIYSPNWALSGPSEQLVLHAETTPQIGSPTLELVACRPTNATGPAFEWASSSVIAAAFSLTEGP